MCKGYGCNHKLNKGPKNIYVKFVSASDAILFMLVLQKSLSYERIKNAKVHRAMNGSKTNK